MGGHDMKFDYKKFSSNHRHSVTSLANSEMINIIENHNTISIVGMDKNVGKTTVLNYILEKTRGSLKLGLTSIGRDGEEEDRVTATEKPRIYVDKGTVIATAKQCLYNGDITREIIRTTGINTAMGEIVICRALSDGYVELGGPSINEYMKEICNDLSNLGCDLVIVDGALGRKSSASPAITEATILSTGAALSTRLEQVVEKTANAVEVLSLKELEEKNILRAINKIGKETKVAIFDKFGKINSLRANTALAASKEIIENLNYDTSVVSIRGILSNKLLEDMMKSTDKYKGVSFVVEDGTKVFVEPHTLLKFKRQGGLIRVINPIKVVCVTANPKSPMGYEFDSKMFLDKLRNKMELPVFDVKNEQL